MWSLCRPAALAQLRRAAVRAPVLRATAAALAPPVSARALATSSTIAGVEMSKLLSQSSSELVAELGKDKLSKVQRALAEDFAEVVASGEETVVADVVQLFSAATKTRLSTLMLRAFDYLLEHSPESIDFVMYGEVFRVLSREHDGAKMVQIYEAAGPFFEPAVPELIYRFGIVGKIELGQMEQAHDLVEQMQNDGHFLNNEILSRLMHGHARDKNAERVVDLYEQLDPTKGHWHESAVDRVILSLGVVGKPELAFDFYVNSNMKLSGGTLMTLLSVCRHNNCRQQAADILENRKRFNLKLNARAFNSILQTLEFLDRHDDIPEVLDEMTNLGIRFDTKTKEIVARNQDVLVGTFFDLSIARERNQTLNPDQTAQPGKKKNAKHLKKRISASMAMPELKALLEQGKFAEAAALSDKLVRPLTIDDLSEEKRHGAEVADGALRVSPSMSKEVVLSYIGNGELDKLDSLLKGFTHAESRVGFALMEIVLAFAEEEKRGRPLHKKLSKQQNELAYRAAKIMVDHEWSIYRAQLALQLFRQFGDVDAARKLCEMVMADYAGQEASKTPKVNAAVVSQTLVGTLRVLVENNDLPAAFEVLDKAGDSGFRVEPFHYVGLLTSMRNNSAYAVKPKGVVVLADDYGKNAFHYSSEDFDAVLVDMEKRGVRVTRGIIANSCLALAAGDKVQRTRLLEGYAALKAAEATGSVRDTFEMPPVVYSVLLQLSGRESNDLTEMKQIYVDAIGSIKDRNGVKRVPNDWEIIVISHLADAGFVEEAAERLKNMLETTGGYSYEAVVKVLRGSILAKHEGGIETALKLLDERGFRLTLSETYGLVHLAKDAELPLVAFDVMELYERAYGHSTAGVVGHAKSRQSIDKSAERKIRSLYRTVLELCEQNGEWKRALTFSTRVNDLLRGFNSEAEGIDGDGDIDEETQRPE